MEEALFARRRDLFTQLQLVVFYTTSIYFEGQGGGTIGQRRHSKDHRPDLKQMIVGAVLDGQGRPICCELWPCNPADVTTLIPVVDRLRSRFGVTKACIVADWDIISKETIEELEKEERGWQYILGARMRSQNEVKDEVLARAGRYRVVHPQRTTSEDPAPLKVKEVRVEGRRYIVCLNDDEARKDAADRQAIVASLQEKLRAGERSLVGNKGYRRYSSSTGPDHFQIDEAKIEEEARYDGKWVLRTNTDLDTAEVALQFNRLWMVQASELGPGQPAWPRTIDPLEVLLVHEALGRLAEKTPSKAELVGLRYSAGCSMAESAQILGIAQATAEEDWNYAKAW